MLVPRVSWVPKAGFHGTHRTHMKESNSTNNENIAIYFLHEPKLIFSLGGSMGVPLGFLGVPGVPRLENFAILNFTVSLGSDLTAKLKKWLYCVFAQIDSSFLNFFF